MSEKSVKINFSDKSFYIFVIALAIIISGVGVYSLTAGVAPSGGHLISVLSPPTGCTSNSVLKWDGTEFICMSSFDSTVPIDVKTTSASTTGVSKSSYSSMNTFIQSNGCSGYHVCTSSELVRYLQEGNDPVGSGTAWYHTGTITEFTSGYAGGDVLLYDCRGYLYSSGDYDTVWGPTFNLDVSSNPFELVHVQIVIR